MWVDFSRFKVIIYYSTPIAKMDWHTSFNKTFNMNIFVLFPSDFE